MPTRQTSSASSPSIYLSRLRGMGRHHRLRKQNTQERVATFPPVNGIQEPSHEREGPLHLCLATPTPIPRHLYFSTDLRGPQPWRSLPRSLTAPFMSGSSFSTARASTHQLPRVSIQPAVLTWFLSTHPLQHLNQTRPPSSRSVDCEPLKNEPSVSISPAPQHAAQDYGCRVF